MSSATTLRIPRSYVIMIVFVLAILGSGSACGEDETVTDAPNQGQSDVTPTPALTPEETSESDDPIATPVLTFGVYDTYARAPIPATYLVDDAHLVVSGQVVDILPAQWTTDDGAPPEPEAALNNFEATIITPVVIRLDGPPLVNRVSFELPIDVASDTIVLAALGGRVGEVQVDTNSPNEQFEKGEHVLVVLRSFDSAGITQLVPTAMGLAWAVSHKYVLTPDDEALSYDGYVSEPAADLINRLVEAAAQLPPVNPVQPRIPTVIASPNP